MREKLDNSVQIHNSISHKFKHLNKITETNNLSVNVILCKQVREKEEIKKSTERKEGNQVHLDNGRN